MKSISLAVVLVILFNFFYQGEVRSNNQLPLKLPEASGIWRIPQSILGSCLILLCFHWAQISYLFSMTWVFSIYKDFLKFLLGTWEWVSFTALCWFPGMASQGTINDPKEVGQAPPSALPTSLSYCLRQ